MTYVKAVSVISSKTPVSRPGSKPVKPGGGKPSTAQPLEVAKAPVKQDTVAL